MYKNCTYVKKLWFLSTNTGIHISLLIHFLLFSHVGCRATHNIAVLPLYCTCSPTIILLPFHPYRYTAIIAMSLCRPSLLRCHIYCSFSAEPSHPYRCRTATLFIFSIIAVSRKTQYHSNTITFYWRAIYLFSIFWNIVIQRTFCFNNNFIKRNI